MDVESGNAGTVETNQTGWIVGYGDWIARLGGDALRHVPADAAVRGVQVKWMMHPAGDDRGTGKPISEGRTISILVSESGRFHLEFSGEAGFPEGDVVRHTLARHGDYVIWGAGVHHRYFVDETCTVLTVRWLPK